MATVRPPSRRRAFVMAGVVAVGMTAVLLLGACSGKSKPEAASEPTTPSSGNGRSATTATTAAPAECLTLPGPQKARVRFVNVYTNATYPNGDIDVWQGAGGADPCRKKLATIPFGAASDYIDVTASDETGNWNVTAFVAGSTDKDHEIVSQRKTWLGGEQATLVFQGAAPKADAPAAAGTNEEFLEKDNRGDASAVYPVPGKASLAIVGSALQFVDPDGAWVAGAVGKPGCLRALSDTATGQTHITGSQLLRYTVDPGKLELALYPSRPGDCSGAPAMGPVTIDAQAGSTAFVFAYGADPDDLALLALPIA